MVRVPEEYESFLSQRGSQGNEQEKEKMNVWLPDEELPGFKAYAVGFFQECAGLSKKLLKALAIGMKLDANYLLDYHKEENNQLRLLHYPESPTEVRCTSDTSNRQQPLIFIH